MGNVYDFKIFIGQECEIRFDFFDEILQIPINLKNVEGLVIFKLTKLEKPEEVIFEKYLETILSGTTFQLNKEDTWNLSSGYYNLFVDGIFINIEGADGTANDVSGIHVDFDPIGGSGDETFTGLLIDGINRHIENGFYDENEYQEYECLILEEMKGGQHEKRNIKGNTKGEHR